MRVKPAENGTIRPVPRSPVFSPQLFHDVIRQLLALAYFGEFVQKILDRKASLLPFLDIFDNSPPMHHDGAVSQGKGLLHAVCDHKGSESSLLDESPCQVDDL